MWEDVYEEVDKGLLKDAIHEIMKSALNEREFTVIVRRFFQELTLREIGKIHRVDAERIRQIEQKALKKLRHPKWAHEFCKTAHPFTEPFSERLKKEAENTKKEEEKQKKEEEEAEKRWIQRIKEENALQKARKRLSVVNKGVMYGFEMPMQNVKMPKIEKPKKPERHSFLPPKQVHLGKDENGKQCLVIDERWGNIYRDQDPERYDFWLKWLKENGDIDHPDRKALVFLRG